MNVLHSMFGKLRIINYDSNKKRQLSKSKWDKYAYICVNSYRIGFVIVRYDEVVI